MSEAVKSNDKNPEIVPHHAAEPDVSLGALAKLSAPIFIANLALMGAATIDTLMTGNLGKEHLAVVALGGATSVMVLFGLVGILQGLSPSSVITTAHAITKQSALNFLKTSGWRFCWASSAAYCCCKRIFGRNSAGSRARLLA